MTTFPDVVDEFPDATTLAAQTLDEADHAQLHENLGVAISAVETFVLAHPGGGSFPDFTGSESPEGVQTANLGQFYEDTDNGGLYAKVQGSGDDVGWVFAGGGFPSNPDVPGFGQGPGGTNTLAMVAPAGQFTITDLLANVGSGNGLNYITDGVDGEQFLTMTLGPIGMGHVWIWAADGTTQFPGAVQFNGDTGFDFPEGLSKSGNGTTQLIGSAVNGVWITDALAAPGTGNGIYWHPSGTDGGQRAEVVTGDSGQFTTTFAADGSTQFPGGVVIDGVLPRIIGPSSGYLALMDPLASAGSGNSIFFHSNGVDGEQHVGIVLGPSGDFVWSFAADGSTQFPGPIGVNGVTPPSQAGAIDVSGETSAVQALAAALVGVGLIAA